MENHLSIIALRTPWTVWKGKKIWHWKMNSPGPVGASYGTGEEWRNNPRKKEGWSQSQNNAQLWIWLVMEVKSDDVKNNIA